VTVVRDANGEDDMGEGVMSSFTSHHHQIWNVFIIRMYCCIRLILKHEEKNFDG
jgi:hypothetical protein